MEKILSKILENPSEFYNDNELNILLKKIYNIKKNKRENKRENNKNTLINENREYVFTDGCSINNGKYNNKGGYSVFFSDNDSRNISKKVNNTTNNIMELTAIYECLKILDKNKKYIIVSDSMYSINSVTKWYKNWEKNNWRKKNGSIIKNKDIIINILSLLEQIDVKFKHIKSHQPKPVNKNSLEYKLWYGNYKSDLLCQNN